MDSKIRYQKAKRVSIISIIGNILLTAIKAIVGTLAGSTALIADAFHSASDLVGTVILMQGLKIAYLPPDESHPYGHQRAEPITAKILAIILILTALGIGYESYKVLRLPKISSPEPIAIYIAFLSVIVKEAMYQYSFRVGKQIKSDAVIADAWHHRTDAFSSVAAVIGIAGALLGYPVMDPIVGIIVSFLILKAGISIYIGAIKILMDTAPPKEILNIIKKSALDTKGVREVKDIKVRQYGAKYVVDIKIGVDPHITVEEGHGVAARAKKNIIESEVEVEDVLIHVNPYYDNGN